MDLRRFLKPPIKIISNLPYNVGTRILLNYITSEEWPPFWHSLTFMFQNEVANRLVASPKTKAYGRLSVITQWRSEVKLLFTVPSSAFLPAPKVDSAVVQITPLTKPYFDTNLKQLQMLVKLAFGQRRKMLRQSLKSLHPNIELILSDSGIDPMSRPEELSVNDFCALATNIH
jgi:16S rRNA (adenine1518-N6/adenine1519-N6)-dimethyltransferase